MTNTHKNEHPSTYTVQDRQNKDERIRLTIQDRMITTAMGGVLPEQSNGAIFQRVLDIGCGPGGWVIQAAQTYPTMTVAGIDVSQRMIEDARAQVEGQGVTDRVEFHVMDALRMLEFPAHFFDLVNVRFGVSWMRTWDWPKLLSEMLRVCRPSGIIRLCEPEIMHHSTSPALKHIQDILLCGLYRSGHLFERDTTGITAHLVPLLKQHGCEKVEAIPFPLTYKAGTAAGEAYAENIRIACQTHRHFFRKWGCMIDDYDRLCQQALGEMQQGDFQVTWNLWTVWGRKRER